jgi:tRNA dimethylallyltransferase
VNHKPIILILGPTAGGKTRLAIDLANAIGGECICADSMQVYRGMDIGTAKPTVKERAAAPHHLLDVADPSDAGFTVDTWLSMAERVIAEVRSRDRYPIVVGGTNLYIKALLHGLFEGPEPHPQLRQRLQAMDEDALRARLEAVDPKAAQRIHRNDRKRTIRAIEVFEQTGKPLSEHQSQWDSGQVREDVRIIGLDYPPEDINPRINARVRQMIDAGLVEEVRTLYEKGALGPQAREALGYKQIMDHLEGRCTLEEAIEQIKIRTRRYAKQQRTWLRRFRAHPGSLWLDASRLSPEQLLEEAVRRLLL